MPSANPEGKARSPGRRPTGRSTGNRGSRQTAAATRGRWLSDSIFRFTLVIRFFRST
jgi:hypothetical protein